MQPLQAPARIQPLEVILSVGQGLSVKTFRPHTFLSEEAPVWLVHSHKQTNDKVFKTHRAGTTP